MKSLRIWTVIALFFGVLVIGISCQPQQNTQKPQDNQLADTLDADAGEISEDVMNLLVSIPNPREGAKLLKDAGATYEEKLLIPENKVNNYRMRDEQALALGVYTADLSYASAFGKKESSLKYLKSMQHLASELSIGNIFDKKLEIRLKENAENKDSLDRIFDDTFDALNEQLKKSKQVSIQSLMFSGAWIETAFLATQHWKQSPKPAIKHQVLERQATLDDLIKILESSKDEDGTKKVLAMFQGLKKDFETKTGEELTDQQAEVIYEKIKKIRTELVK